MANEKRLHPKTLAVRGGRYQTPFREHSEPLFLTSSFTFDSAEQGAAIFAGEEEGNIYSRFTNPTVTTFEERYAALEGGEAGLAVASGMAAIFTTCMALLSAGDRIVCARNVFGSTFTLLDKILPRWGIEVVFVDLADLEQWQRAITPGTRLVFVETPSNPTLEIVDLRSLSEIAHAAGAIVAVDNAFCTPALQRPIELGADLTVSTATKFIDGQGRVLGGIIAGSRELVRDTLFNFVRTTGPTLSAFNAWILLKGLETLELRMNAHCDHAEAVATWLAERSDLAAVTYPGLPDYRYHELARRQMARFGSLITFDVGSVEAAACVIDRLQLFSRTANLGDAKSIVSHPATTTHFRMGREERLRAGVTDGLIRLSIGLEDPRDLIADLEQALGGR